MRYPVTLTKDTNGTFLVRFPDVPDAITFGDTKEEALAQAQDALLTVFDAYMRDRRDIPAPSERIGVSVELPALETSKIELYRAMRAAEVNKSELARRLRWHLPQVDRVIDVRHGSQIDQIEAAFAALGKRLVVNVVDADAGVVRAALRAMVQQRPRPVHAGVLAAARHHRPRHAAAAGRSSASRAKRAAKKR
jgi:antitoxin HicB